jgi:AraC-like DNA-binding protein
MMPPLDSFAVRPAPTGVARRGFRYVDVVVTTPMVTTVNRTPTDPLSGVLDMLHLRGEVVGSSQLVAPWGISFPAGLARFHLIERGSTWLHVKGVKPAFEVFAGDLVMFVNGAGHILTSGRSRSAIPLEEAVIDCAEPNVVRIGRAEPQTVLVCGTFSLDAAASKALLAILPPVLVIQGRGGRPSESLEWMLKLFSIEATSRAPGHALAASRLVDLLLVEAVRSWLQKQSKATASWLGGLRDARIAKALSEIHATPERNWTVNELAAAAGMSRSPFAAKFTALVGEPPLKYLTRWRMQLATRWLRGGDVSVAEIAERVGYDSEAAFSRAFKRWTGETAGGVRRQTRFYRSASSRSTRASSFGSRTAS